MTSHEFDAFLDTQDLQAPPYHEQIAVMYEVELDREESVRQQGAIDALKQLRNRLAFFVNAYCTTKQVATQCWNREPFIPPRGRKQ